MKKKKAGARYVDLRPKKPAQPSDVGTLLARELKRCAKLAGELERVKRRLARSRMRYNVLKRLSGTALFKVEP